MLPLRLFRARPFSAATGVCVLVKLCLYGALIRISLYLQQSRPWAWRCSAPCWPAAAVPP